jgi:hypothetical protein
MGQSSSQTNPYYTNTAANNLGMLSGIAGIGSHQAVMLVCLMKKN